ncbi:exodeoxyribonuclease VII large subunit [Taylorella equigenitalis]|uniref:exodeoxyribonuclease VII large subunit n=1 Tax=Taylorella equigenitalis TaxID=29575 RepID=UPI00237CD642|nr:exodeoxyribonuclease VII large subunit [Taylorella equigenitalis]WDU55540.1 exodeoxyribonuclease VII large subunit [Taylorella equigenitalis]
MNSDLFSSVYEGFETISNTEPLPKVYSVSELLMDLKSTLKNFFTDIKVVGEISGFKISSVGHAYFNLKDENGEVVKCSRFNYTRIPQKTNLRDGLLVEITGSLSVYTKNGDVQLIISKIEEQGKGTLHEQLEALKRKLSEEGIFNKKNDLNPPKFVKSVGIVSSLGAAALKDVLTTLNRRTPFIDVVIYPSLVQGEQAPGQMITALEKADSMGHDAILLVRGGGSIEDLWAFNDESLARKISELKTYIICGVGHEIDFSLADLASNHRAPTPTAAAEILSKSKDELNKDLVSKSDLLIKLIENYINNLGQTLDYKMEMLISPQNHIKIQLSQVDGYKTSLNFALDKKLTKAQNYLNNIHSELRSLFKFRFMEFRSIAKNLITSLKAYNPKGVLERGFALVYDSKGKLVKTARDVGDGELLKIEFADSAIRAQVPVSQD